MNHKLQLLFALFGSSLLGASTLHAVALSLTAGDVTLNYDDQDTDNSSLTVGGAGSLDNLYEYGFYFVRGDGTVIKLENGTQIDSNTIGYEPQTNVFVEVSFELPSSTAPDVNVNITMQNDTGGTINRGVIFYFDYDLANTIQDHTATYDSMTELMTISEVNSGVTAQVDGVGAAAFQIDSYSDLRTSIENDIALDNTGSGFGPGDFTGAFQWDFSLVDGAIDTVESLTVIPEPRSFSLILGVAVFCCAGRRRFRLIDREIIQ